MSKRLYILILLGLLTVAISSSCVGLNPRISDTQTNTEASTQSRMIDIPVVGGNPPESVSLECFVDGKKGYMDVTGKLVIPRCFDSVSAFSDSVARVKIAPLSEGADNLWGYINLDGHFLIPPRLVGNQFVESSGMEGFQGYSSFSEGLLPLKQEVSGRVGYINYSGEFVIPPQFTIAKPFHEGLAAICVEAEQCGYINTLGEIVVETRYQATRSFYNGVAVVSLPGPGDLKTTTPYEIYDFFGLINRAGEYLVPPELNKVRLLERFLGIGVDDPIRHPDTPFSPEGLLPVRVPYSEEEVADFYALSLYPPTDGVEANLGHGRWGYAIKTGGYAIEPRYWQAGLFKNGYADVVIAEGDTDYPQEFWNRSAVIDAEGHLIDREGEAYLNSNLERHLSASDDIYLAFDSFFSQGLAAAAFKPRDQFARKNVGYVNAQGTFVIEPQFDRAEAFAANGLAVVTIRAENEDEADLQGLIDYSGNFLIEPLAADLKIFDNGLVGISSFTGEKYDQLQGKRLIFVPTTQRFLPYYASYADSRSEFDVEGFIPIVGKIPEDFRL
ncbi:MAG: WG repeat-containing protein [Leptolyngbyaceae cyanobacterium]